MNEMPFRQTWERAAAGASVQVCEADFPLRAALAADRACLAVITRVEGASYRPAGAAMVITADGTTTGSLSSGCIERDVVLHALAAIETNTPKRLIYGRGSSFIDLQLPCGGGLEITLIPHPSRPVLERAATRLAGRRIAAVAIGEDGRLGEMPTGGDLIVRLVPGLRLLVFGKGPEPRTFAALAKAAGQDVTLYSPDAETRAGIDHAFPLNQGQWPVGVEIDDRTAVALFFHDHDWEPPLLKHALKSPALFVGAQGSARARQKRADALAAEGVCAAALARLARPFGLVASARDPHSLAAGVLAQVMDHARIA
ncbi:XdhC family protein [Martelella endophytica]|uniref:XdhC family protein n=1 Tax=Martelella endophytica TaxID=1486262 RepID=UPI00069705F2|nr:XdhC family protein [Martelella endophytica]